MLLTARMIQNACGELPFIFRAGAWKPRTSPYSFQGAGEEALQWLVEVKKTLGIEVATEVATAEHVRAALKAGIDYLWIGARTSANPIAVQAIADAIAECRLQRTDCRPKGVLVKNPVHDDCALWIGNIERIEKTGIPVMAVHRGCNHQPHWQMAHTLRNTRPDIPLLIDPSHMSGEATRVAGLVKQAALLEYNGAMIEVHPTPTRALSDAKQQITPSEVQETLDPLATRYRLVSDFLTPCGDKQSAGTETELTWLRAEIDELDEVLWQTIAKRMDVSRRIGEWKKEHHVAPLQPERYKEIVNKLKLKEEQLGLPQEFMQQLFDLIHEESLRQQK